MARPRKAKADARIHRLNLRLVLEERAVINSKARAAGLSATDYARHAALIGYVQAAGQPIDIARPDLPPNNSAETLALTVALNRVGVNLNQIARSLNSGLGYAPPELVASLDRVNELLDGWQGIKK